MSYPTSVAVDREDKVYVLDESVVYVVTAAGELRVLAGSAQGYAEGTGTAARFSFARGIAIDASRNIYVADAANHRIRKVTPAGVVTTVAGSGATGRDGGGFANGPASSARFNFPEDVAVDSAGNLYVADTNNHRIRRIRPSGEVETFAGNGVQGASDGAGTAAQFSSPAGVAIGADGHLYVSDSVSSRIRKLTPLGEVTTLAGGGAGWADGSGGSARFDAPAGLVVDLGGNVIVADRFNRRIRRITAAAIVSTLAGSGPTGPCDCPLGITNGPGSAATFQVPRDVAMDSHGNLYVADYDNHVIRKIQQ